MAAKLLAILVLQCLAVSMSVAEPLRLRKHIRSRGDGAQFIFREDAMLTDRRRLQQQGSTTCNNVPPNFRFYPGLFFNNGTNGTCNSMSSLTADALKQQAASCAQDPMCTAFTALPSNGQTSLCAKNQTFLLSKLSDSTTDPCQGVYIKESCPQPVPTGYVFYPTYDTNTSSSGGCKDYRTQDGYSLWSALAETTSVFISQCNNNQGCTGVSFLPRSDGDIIASACYKYTAANLTQYSFNLTNPCEGVYVKATTITTDTASPSTTGGGTVTNDVSPPPPSVNDSPPRSPAPVSSPPPTQQSPPPDSPPQSPPAQPSPSPSPSPSPLPEPSPSPSPSPSPTTAPSGGGGKSSLAPNQYGTPTTQYDTSAQYTGDLTYYTSAGRGMCYTQLNNDGTGLYAAMSGPLNAQLNPSGQWPPPWCFTQAQVTGPAGSAVVTFVDMCPECALGSVDVTQELFKMIAGDLVIGRQHGITWHFI